MSWVLLVLVVSGHGVGIQAIDMGSREVCEAARVEAMKLSPSASAVCLRRMGP